MIRLVIQNKRRDLGLGSISLVDVEEARAKALEYRKKARAGLDPFAEVEKAERAATPFKEIAQEVYEQVVLNSTSNGKHQDQWINTLKTYAFPVIGDKALDDTTTQDIQNILLPIWLSKSETARRVQQRMGRVFKYAISHRIATDNPVERGKENLASKKMQKQVRHHRALDCDSVPSFMRTLENSKGTGALAFRFLILTAARAGMVRKARWSEIDFEGGCWTVPEEHMKTRKEFQVPLVLGSLQVLHEAREFQDGEESLIFQPQMKPGHMISDGTFRAILERHGKDCVPHGFRTSFRQFAESEGIQLKYKDKVKEAALSHTTENEVAAAYNRTNYYYERVLDAKQMMFQTDRRKRLKAKPIWQPVFDADGNPVMVKRVRTIDGEKKKVMVQARRCVGFSGGPILGMLIAFEITHGKGNGWHPHFHIIFFVRTSSEKEARKALAMKSLWLRCLKANGLSGSGHGFKLSSAKEAGNYISKFGAADGIKTSDLVKRISEAKKSRDWTLASELTAQHRKKSTRKAGAGRNPWEFLEDYTHEDDKQAGALFIEFAEVFHGKQQLQWSQGLKDVVGIDEITDEEAADSDAEFLGELDRIGITISPNDWYGIRYGCSLRHTRRLISSDTHF